MKRLGHVIQWTLFLSLTAGNACFAGFQIREISRASDYTGSKPAGVSIDPDGRIRLAGSLTSVWKSDEDSACWTVATSQETIFMSTANDGKIYRYLKGRTDLLFDSPEVGILSLLPSPGNSLLAGSAPDGLIYSVSETGHTHVFARTDTVYVWDLIRLQDGNILAATGLPASVKRFDPSGRLLETIDIKADHVRAMAPGTDGGIWLGTANPARIYFLNNSDLQLVHEAAAAEISTMAADSTGLWFATVASPAINYSDSERPDKLNPRKPDTSQPAEQNSVWRIDETRTVCEYWTTAWVPIFDMTIMDNKPYIVCGGEGFLIRIDGIGRGAIMAVRRQEPLTCLSTDSRGVIWAGAATTAELYQYDTTPESSGTLDSMVIDAGASAAWGRIRLEGDAVSAESVQMETRTGNSPEPDSEWSEWAVTGKQLAVTSPPGRYLQWRMTLTQSGNRQPVIDAVIISMKTGNRPPFIKNVQVYPVVKGEIVEQPGRGRMFQQTMPDGLRVEYFLPNSVANGLSKGMWMQLRGMRTIIWDAGDPDNDLLEYMVEIAVRDRESDWFLLENNVTQPMLSFDSTAFSDGFYRIRIQASDKPSNPYGEYLTAECLSNVFDIDNSPPIFEDLSVAEKSGRTGEAWNIRITGNASDNGSRINRLEYSIDSHEWVVFSPCDGMPDQSLEPFDLHLKGSASQPCPSQVFLRVTDSQENVTITNISLSEISK
ncbi:hypothetical protein JW823_09970 [bacterium]|nr:hypothetical protein [candidate division CSSED10-310 bacterium]